MSRFVLILTVVALSACAVSPERWARASDKGLCEWVGAQTIRKSHRDGVQELVRRRKVRPEAVATIHARKLAIGMNSCEMVAAVGPPTDQNRSVSAWGTRTQWVYDYYGGTVRAGSYKRPLYIYTENQIVTSWQD